MFKYGVVQEDDLLIDLHFWKNYFLAGRMQKPILISQLGTKFETKLSKDLDYNRRNAVRIYLYIRIANLGLITSIFELSI